MILKFKSCLGKNSSRWRIERVAAKCLFNLLPFGLAFTFATTVSADVNSLRVASFNLNWGNKDKAKVLAAIEKANADVICFQESTAETERFLRAELAMNFPHFKSVGHLGRYFGERFSFASKFELTDVKFSPPNAGLFGFYCATIDKNERSTRIVNVHLTPFQMKRGGGIAEAFAALEETEKKHAIEIEKIVESIDLKTPTIVAGDFNSISTYVAPKRVTEIGFVDGFAKIHSNADNLPTWSWPTKPIPLNLRIDYVFHSPHFRVRDAELVGDTGSDHAVVVVEIEWKNEPEIGGKHK